MQKKRVYGAKETTIDPKSSGFSTTPALGKMNSALISGTAGTLSGNLDPLGVEPPERQVNVSQVSQEGGNTVPA
jgi:hypothetical protein